MHNSGADGVYRALSAVVLDNSTAAALHAQLSSSSIATPLIASINVTSFVLCSLAAYVMYFRTKRFRSWPNVFVVVITAVSAAIGLVGSFYMFVGFNREKLIRSTAIAEDDASLYYMQGSALCSTQIMLITMFSQTVVWLQTLFAYQVQARLYAQQAQTWRDIIYQVIFIVFWSFVLGLLAALTGVPTPTTGVCSGYNSMETEVVLLFSYIIACVFTIMFIGRMYQFVRRISGRIPLSKRAEYRLADEVVEGVVSLQTRAFKLTFGIGAVSIVIIVLSIAELVTLAGVGSAAEFFISAASDFISVSLVQMFISPLLCICHVYIASDAILPSCGDEEVWVARAVDLDDKRFRGQFEVIGLVSSTRSYLPPRQYLKSAYWRHVSYFSLAQPTVAPQGTGSVRIPSFVVSSGDVSSFKSSFVPPPPKKRVRRSVSEGHVLVASMETKLEALQVQGTVLQRKPSRKSFQMQPLPQSLATAKYNMSDSESHSAEEDGAESVVEPVGDMVDFTKVAEPKVQEYRKLMFLSGATAGSNRSNPSGTKTTTSNKETSSVSRTLWSRMWAATVGRDSSKRSTSPGSGNSALQRTTPMLFSRGNRRQSKAEATQAHRTVDTRKATHSNVQTRGLPMQNGETSEPNDHMTVDIPGQVPPRSRRPTLEEINEAYRQQLAEEGLVNVALQAAKDVIRRRSIEQPPPRARRKSRKSSGVANIDVLAAQEWMETAEAVDNDGSAVANNAALRLRTAPAAASKHMLGYAKGNAPGDDTLTVKKSTVLAPRASLENALSTSSRHSTIHPESTQHFAMQRQVGARSSLESPVTANAFTQFHFQHAPVPLSNGAGVMLPGSIDDTAVIAKLSSSQQQHNHARVTRRPTTDRKDAAALLAAATMLTSPKAVRKHNHFAFDAAPIQACVDSTDVATYTPHATYIPHSSNTTSNNKLPMKDDVVLEKPTQLPAPGEPDDPHAR